MKSFTSIVGWMLLVALIAVPSVFFYNWVTNKKNADADTASLPSAPPPATLFAAGAEKAAPAGETAPPAQSRTWNPPPAAAAAPVQKPGPAVPAPAAQTFDSAQGKKPSQAFEPPPSASSPPPRMPSQPAENPAQAAQPPASAPGTAPPAAGGVRVSTQPKLVSYFDPKSQRDPTMSPDDYQKIRDEENRRRAAERREKERLAQEERMRGPARNIALQGIVGSEAIISGEMYRIGQTVKGARIVKVGSDFVIFEWKDKGEVKRFTKRMQ